MKYSLSAKNLVCRNMEAKASYCAGLLNPDNTREITGVLRTDSGLLSHTFNQVVSNAVMPTRILQRFVVDYFAERHSPFTLWHCASKPLEDIELAELGVMREDTLVAMAVEVQRLAADEQGPPELEVAPAAADEIAAYAELQAEAFDGSREAPQIRKFYRQLQELPEHKRGRLKLFLGKWEGEPVAAGCLFASADALGFYDLVTREAYRGRGIGRALFQHLVARALGSHHKHAVALTPVERQQLYLDTGFFAVGEVARYRYEP